MHVRCGPFGCGWALPMAVLDGVTNAESVDSLYPPTPGSSTPSPVNRRVLGVIRGYQRHGRKVAKCRFEPTCSTYGAICFERYPFAKAAAKTAWRLIRCHPWSRSGPTFDPP